MNTGMIYYTGNSNKPYSTSLELKQPSCIYYLYHSSILIMPQVSTLQKKFVSFPVARKIIAVISQKYTFQRVNRDETRLATEKLTAGKKYQEAITVTGDDLKHVGFGLWGGANQRFKFSVTQLRNIQLHLIVCETAKQMHCYKSTLILVT